MKNAFFMLPVAIAVLAACSSTTPAPVENADGTLPPGTMQPVESNTSWQPQIQQQTMPENMTAPRVQPVSQPAVSAPSYPTTQPAPAVTKTTSAVKTASAKANSVSQNFEIPRNPETNAPDYSKIDKGFYKGNTYTVRKGDTMFLIAYICGIDVKELAALNNMSEPYTLSVGQTLKVANGSNTSEEQTAQAPAAKPAEPEVTYTAGPNGTKYGSDGSIIGPIKSSAGSPALAAAATTATVASTPVVNKPTTQTAPSPAVSNVAWQWPTSGNIVQGFSNADGGNKGIDISGSRGQAVNAAAAGRVVYAGNALRGYGNLIIIKHNDDFLSAYAHNETILVKDQQEVKAGQQIAKMGSSGTNSVKLHFEIRYKGKSVDPTRYLPRR